MLASAEVGTLITALGCGIGPEEFNVDKLRYHRIIIMTDADVDGSHIRTLLLTFFYRQMPVLIERGHVYIGLPPLYKLKQGKQELYLKDDAALNAYLIANAVEGAEFRYSSDAPPLREGALECLLHDFDAATDQIGRLSQRCDPAVLAVMLDMAPPGADLWQEPALAARWVDAISTRVNRDGLGRPSYVLRVRAADADHNAALIIERRQHGITTTQTLPATFFAGAEFKAIRDVAEQLAGLIQSGAEIRRGANATAVSTFAQVRNWLLDETKKGRTIQRFKGLGE